MEKFLYPIIGTQNMLLIGTASSVVACVVVYCFEEQLDLKNLTNRNLLIQSSSGIGSKEVQMDELNGQQNKNKGKGKELYVNRMK
jgi:hypothetical protein